MYNINGNSPHLSSAFRGFAGTKRRYSGGQTECPARRVEFRKSNPLFDSAGVKREEKSDLIAGILFAFRTGMEDLEDVEYSVSDRNGEKYETKLVFLKGRQGEADAVVDAERKKHPEADLIEYPDRFGEFYTIAFSEFPSWSVQMWVRQGTVDEVKILKDDLMFCPVLCSSSGFLRIIYDELKSGRISQFMAAMDDVDRHAESLKKINKIKHETKSEFAHKIVSQCLENLPNGKRAAPTLREYSIRPTAVAPKVDVSLAGEHDSISIYFPDFREKDIGCSEEEIVEFMDPVRKLISNPFASRISLSVFVGKTRYSANL